jgi:hypothetical protein
MTSSRKSAFLDQYHEDGDEFLSHFIQVT